MLMSVFSGSPTETAAFSVVLSDVFPDAFSEELSADELSAVLSAAAEVLAVVVSLFFEELELLSPAQPVKSERAARTDTILNLFFIIIHLKITFRSYIFLLVIHS